MDFSPEIGQTIELPLRTTQSPHTLYFYATAPTKEYNPAKQYQIWTNLPQAQQIEFPVKRNEWNAIPYLSLSSTAPASHSDGSTAPEAQNQVSGAEVTLDPLHDWTNSRFAYTIRIIDLESGEVEWLAREGVNGEIVFTCGSDYSVESVRDDVVMLEEIRRVRADQVRELDEFLRTSSMENTGNEGNGSDSLKLLRRFIEAPSSDAIPSTNGGPRQDFLSPSFLSNRLSATSSLTPFDTSSTLVLSKSSADGVTQVGFWNASSQPTSEIVNLLDISDAISSSLSPDGPLTGRYLVMIGDSMDLIDAEELDSVKTLPRIFARPLAQVVIIPGSCLAISITKIHEVASSVGDGRRKLAVGCAGQGKANGFEFDGISSIKLHPATTRSTISLSTRIEMEPATLISSPSYSSSSFTKPSPSPPPIPRLFLLPLYFFSLVQLLSNTDASSKADSSSHLLDFLKDLITSPFVTVWIEGASIMRFVAAMGLWLMSLVLSRTQVGRAQNGVGSGSVGAGLGSSYMDPDGRDESTGDAFTGSTTSPETLAITLKSLDTPLRLYFPSPNHDQRLSAESTIKITLDKTPIDDSLILTERSGDDSGMLVMLDLRGFVVMGGREGGVVEISC